MVPITLFRAEPLTDSWIDHTFAQLKMDFSFGWFADPIFLTGHYPWQMRTVFFFQLPWFSWAESDLIKGSADFVSVNHYTSTYVTYPLYKTKSIKQEGSIGWTAIYASKNGTAIGNRAESDWLYNVPWGFTKLLKYIKERYNNPEIYITENGFSVPNEQRENLVGALSDPERVDYFNGYLLAMKKAIVESNVRVKGYFAWTLVDNFEWAVGYQERFGVTHVDFKTQKRTMKASAYFLKYFFSHAIMN